jgi:hypothetical protein
MRCSGQLRLRGKVRCNQSILHAARSSSLQDQSRSGCTILVQRRLDKLDVFLEILKWR